MTRSRSGFTLIEMMVAMVVFSVGLLALASSASGIMKMMGSSQSRTLAAGIAASRFEQIRAQQCPNRAATGSATKRGVQESWVLNRFARADDVTVTITFSADHKVRSQAFTSYLPC